MPPPPPPKLKSTKSSEFWNALKRLTVYLCTPENSASLAAFRILFYALMVLDIPHERAFAYVDYAYGSKANPCQFPLFDSVPRPSALTASVIFIIMLTGAFGSLLGLCYKISTLMFAGAYWFIFIQDKTSWNNHSYLYGLIGSMFCFMDANARWSIDAHINKYKNKRVPKWNYFLLRAQIFLVYFLAGLKKTEIDWLTGYSCSEIVHHWVFSPFRLFLPNEYISWIVVHICGFLIDLFVGFLLVYKPTRLFATLVVSCFHGMNSMIFSIGMFPYVMLCTTTIFYSYRWPLNLIGSKAGKDEQDEGTLNPECIYPKETETDSDKHTPITKRHTNVTYAIIFYFIIQLLLPYSHFITKGYNGWTNGLYGYSWDMMVHSWHTQHIKITCFDKKTNRTFFLQPDAYTTENRWSSHPDMIKQYGVCIAKQLAKKYKKNQDRFAVYMDIWRSMNHRFEQRQVNPKVDIVSAEWSPFRTSEFMIPLYRNLSEWRPRIEATRNALESIDNGVQLTFVADSPGLSLRNFVEGDISAAIVILDGEVNVENVKAKTNTSLSPNSKPMRLKSGQFHVVHVTSSYPACYYYVFRNSVSHIVKLVHDRMLNHSLSVLENKSKKGKLKRAAWDVLLNKLNNSNFDDFTTEDEMKVIDSVESVNQTNSIKIEIMNRLNETVNEQISKQDRTFASQLSTLCDNVINFFKKKFAIYKRCFHVVVFTFECLLTQKSIETAMLEKYDMLLPD